MQDNNQNENAAVLYGRSATMRAANPVADQLALGAATADVKGQTVVATLSDGGVSGAWKTPPPALEEAIRLIETRKARYLIVHDLDRISRSWPNVRAVMERVTAANGVLVVAVAHESYDGNDLGHKIMLAIRDQMDRATTLDLQRKAARRNERRRELAATRRLTAATA